VAGREKRKGETDQVSYRHVCSMYICTHTHTHTHTHTTPLTNITHVSTNQIFTQISELVHTRTRDPVCGMLVDRPLLRKKQKLRVLMSQMRNMETICMYVCMCVCVCVCVHIYIYLYTYIYIIHTVSLLSFVAHMLRIRSM
jgi:hypothetical protein